jgi:hypothetical protein
MKKNYRISTIFLACVMASVALLSSCEDDEPKNNGEVTLLSFGPAGVKHGEQISFIGVNLDKVTSIVLAPEIEISSGSFESQSSELIVITIPEEAEAGIVLLKTPTGEIETKTPLNFEVPVVISSITAASKPGSNITIKGSKINWIEEVVFRDDVSVTEFVSQTSDELVVTVPMEAETGFLVFKTGGTEPLTFASEEELVLAVPAIADFSPAEVRHTGTVTITGTDLDLVTALTFAGDKTVFADEFINHTETEIEVTVPAGSLKGPLTLLLASTVTVVSANDLTIVLPKGTTVSPNPVTPGSESLTINGTDLDLVASLSFPTVVAPVAASAFTTHTPTQIVVPVPLGTKSGGIMFKTIHEFSGSLGVNVTIPGAGPPPLAITLFDEAPGFGGGDWSWGGTSNPASTEQFYSGTKSFKHATSGSDGGASVGGMSGVDASGQDVLKFSLYGGAGTDGKSVAIILGSDGADKWDSYNSVTIQEGEWTEYSIPLSSYATVNLSNVTRWIAKVEGATDPVIYVDRLGFDAAGPDPLDYYIYDDGLKNSWSEWDGWGHTTKDFANEEEVFKGTKAIKMVFNDQYGAVQFGAPSTGVFAGYTTLSFRVYSAAGQNLIVQLNNESDHGLTIPAGWSVVDIPIADLVGNASVTELRFKNNNASLPATLYFDEIGLKE